MTTEFANGQTMRLSNTAVNADAGSCSSSRHADDDRGATTRSSACMVKKVSGTVNVTPEAREATILSVNVPRLKYRPGETVKAFVTYRPFRGGEAIAAGRVRAAARPAGGARTSSSSPTGTQFLADEQPAKPFRFTAESVDEVFAVLQECTAIRHDAVYVRLVRQADGVAIGRTAMPKLPSSRREVLLGAGRSNTTPFVSSTTKTIPTKYVMDGSAQFEITIDKNAKVEIGGKPGAKQEPPTPATPATPTTPRRRSPKRSRSRAQAGRAEAGRPRAVRSPAPRSTKSMNHRAHENTRAAQ